MKEDYRPYIIKKLHQKFTKWYVNHFLRPRFKRLGKWPSFTKPWYVRVYGSSVELDDYATVVGNPDKRIQLVSWPPVSDLHDFSKIEGCKNLYDKLEDFPKNNDGAPIRIGKYALLCPGVKIQAASSITIGDGCMIAQSAYITDADWHGIYNRCRPVGNTAPIDIGENVWISDHATICKGVTIGDNSIIGTGAVVTRDVPPNVISAGNPAMVVKKLDPNGNFKTREAIFSGAVNIEALSDILDREFLKGNTILGWLRHLIAPRMGD